MDDEMQYWHYRSLETALGAVIIPREYLKVWISDLEDIVEMAPEDAEIGAIAMYLAGELEMFISRGEENE